MSESPSQSFRIWYENLSASDEGEDPQLSALTVDDHIHGGLRIEIGGRLVPSLGFFGSDDVCFNTWLEEFWAVACAFESSDVAQYTFDEGEQGQPAYLFERSGDRAWFSIVEAEFSGGTANPDWQRVEFLPQAFLAEHARFRESFFATIKAAAPDVGEQWIHEHDPAQQQ